MWEVYVGALSLGSGIMEVLTLFTARGDGVHVPQCLHEGGIDLELPTGC